VPILKSVQGKHGDELRTPVAKDPPSFYNSLLILIRGEVGTVGGNASGKVNKISLDLMKNGDKDGETEIVYEWLFSEEPLVVSVVGTLSRETCCSSVPLGSDDLNRFGCDSLVHAIELRRSACRLTA